MTRIAMNDFSICAFANHSSWLLTSRLIWPLLLVVRLVLRGIYSFKAEGSALFICWSFRLASIWKYHTHMRKWAIRCILISAGAHGIRNNDCTHSLSSSTSICLRVTSWETRRRDLVEGRLACWYFTGQARKMLKPTGRETLLRVYWGR